MSQASVDAGISLSDRQRLVYVVRQDALLADDADQFDLFRTWTALWKRKWFIAATTLTFALLSITYVVTAKEWYRADVVLAPAAPKSTQGVSGQLASLGGLASLAGISIGGGDTAEPLAVLKSRNFTRMFIEEFNLLPVLYADKWDSKASRWTSQDSNDWPDIRDAVRYFGEDIRRVQEDKKTGLITLTIEWSDAVLAASWANAIAERINERMRQRALVEADANVAYLQGELGAAQVVELQQSIGRLLESELQKVMLAKGNKEFAFRIIDKAEVSKWRSRPNRLKIVSWSVLIGSMLSIIMVLLFDLVERVRAKNGANPASAKLPKLDGPNLST